MQKHTNMQKLTQKHVQKHKTRPKTLFLTHVDFGSFFGRPGFPQQLALLLQPLPGMTGAAEKKKN